MLKVDYIKVEGTAKYAYYVECCVSILCKKQPSPILFPARIDTGADITCIPQAFIPEEYLPLKRENTALIRGCTGVVTRENTYACTLHLAGSGRNVFRPSYGVLITNSNVGLIGMDILKHCNMLFVNERWQIARRS